MFGVYAGGGVVFVPAIRNGPPLEEAEHRRMSAVATSSTVRQPGAEAA